GNRGRLSPGRRGHQAHVDDIESQAVDPLDQAGQGAPVRQLRPEGGGARPYGDFAVLELRAERGARLPEKSDLISLWLHQVTPPGPLALVDGWLQHAARSGLRN